MYLNNSKQIVIKIGSSLLIDDRKKIRKKWLLSFAKDVKELIKNKKRVIIVSSGAIALGWSKMRGALYADASSKTCTSSLSSQLGINPKKPATVNKTPCNTKKLMKDFDSPLFKPNIK